MDTEILRPNAPGDECNINYQVGCSGCPNHYDCVYEVTQDGDTTHCRTAQHVWERDLYNLTNHTGEGTINHITVYAWMKAWSVDNPYRIAIKSGTGTGAPDTVDETYEVDVGVIDTWVERSHQWATNPATESPWTWDEIDRLQAGISVYARTGAVGCTQLYVVVDYTVVVGWTGKIGGVTNPAKIMGVDVANIAKVKGVA